MSVILKVDNQECYLTLGEDYFVDSATSTITFSEKTKHTIHIWNEQGKRVEVFISYTGGSSHGWQIA